MRKNDWRCRAQVTPARLICRAYVACVPTLAVAPVLFTHAVVTEIKIIKTISPWLARSVCSALIPAHILVSLIFTVIVIF